MTGFEFIQYTIIVGVGGLGTGIAIGVSIAKDVIAEDIEDYGKVRLGKIVYACIIEKDNRPKKGLID